MSIRFSASRSTTAPATMTKSCACSAKRHTFLPTWADISHVSHECCYLRLPAQVLQNSRHHHDKYGVAPPRKRRTSQRINACLFWDFQPWPPLATELEVFVSQQTVRQRSAQPFSCLHDCSSVLLVRELLQQEKPVCRQLSTSVHESLSCSIFQQLAQPKGPRYAVEHLLPSLGTSLRHQRDSSVSARSDHDCQHKQESASSHNKDTWYLRCVTLALWFCVSRSVASWTHHAVHLSAHGT